MTVPFRTLNMYQGASFATEIQFVDGETGEPLDLTGRTARMQARTSIEDPVATLNLSTEDGTLVLQGDGVLRFNVSAADTALLGAGTYDVQQWVYDIELVTPGPTVSVRRVLTGVVVFWPEITRME